MDRKEIGLYIHIPFCKQKCYYCDFVSYCNQDINIIEQYVESVIKEIENYNLSQYNITTIYIGGGTPSFIDSRYIKKILSHLEKNENAEITIEINPGTITYQKLLDYKETDINRISIGLQTTNNELLKTIGRIHNYKDFLETYEIATKLGFKNINVDLMLGLPNQTIQDLKHSINDVVKLNPNHISIYSLTIEPGTKIEKMIDSKILKLPSDELERNMYWYTKNLLELNGYKHYEISNFAKIGKESKHNVNCWNQKEYIGIGAAAHSYLNGIRYQNKENIQEYIQNVKTIKKIENIKIVENLKKQGYIVNEVQNKEDMKNEYMLLGLRKIDGVSITKFKEKYGDNPIFIYRKELQDLTQDGLIEVDGDRIKLTNKGLDFANLVWEKFVNYGDGDF